MRLSAALVYNFSISEWSGRHYGIWGILYKRQDGLNYGDKTGRKRSYYWDTAIGLNKVDGKKTPPEAIGGVFGASKVFI